MHSRIFQISPNPIDTDDYPSDREIAGSSSWIDYALEIDDENERREEIQDLVEWLLPKGMFELNADGESITYKGGMEQWRRDFVERLHGFAGVITSQNVYNSMKLFELEHEIKWPLGNETMFVFEDDAVARTSGDFMECYVNGLNVGDVLYIGAVFDYHY